MEDVTQVPTDYLLSLINPLEFDVWGCGSVVTLEMVAAAEYVTDQWDADDDWQVWSAEEHAGRIRFLADQEELAPIGLDVGVPSLGCHSQRIDDGHHRLVAAVYRGDTFVPCQIDGEVGLIDKLVESYYWFLQDTGNADRNH